MKIQEVPNIIKLCDKTNISLLIESKHGIGKSSILKQFAKENDMEWEILILSLLDVGDLAGLPVSRTIQGQESTVWSSPAWHTRIVNRVWKEELEIKDLMFKNKEMKEKFLGSSYNKNKTISREDLNNFYCNIKDIQNYNGINPLLQQNEIVWNKAKRTVLVLDEFNRSATDILNASLQLVLDKRLNDHVLPWVGDKKPLVVAAINPDDSNYAVNTFDPAMLDRFMYINIEPNLDSFLAYARDKKLNNHIQEFLLQNNDKLYFEPENDNNVTTTPRSWEMLSRVIDNLDIIPAKNHYAVIKGLISSEIASQFIQFLRTFKNQITFNKVNDTIKTTTGTIEEVADKIKEKFVKFQEPLQQLDMAKAFYNYYKDAKVEITKPLLVYLYSINLEQATAMILETKKEDRFLKKISNIDKFHNDNNLLKKILISSNVFKDELTKVNDLNVATES